MIYEDRRHAGRLLAEALRKYAGKPNTIVLGLPRGGVAVAYEVAATLKLPLDIVCPRKVGAPSNPELAIGAVTETGEGYFNDEMIEMLGVPDSYIQAEVAKEKARAAQRLKIYRQNRPPLNLEGMTVLLIDDGLATGATMKAAIQSVKAQDAAHVIAAVPVGPMHTVQEIAPEVDDIICPATPAYFMAVGQFYDNFDATEDEEVIELLSKMPLKPSTS